MATASYIKHLGYPEKTPDYTVKIANEIIPFMIEEDGKWKSVEKTKITQNPKIPAFK